MISNLRMTFIILHDQNWKRECTKKQNYIFIRYNILFKNFNGFLVEIENKIGLTDIIISQIQTMHVSYVQYGLMEVYNQGLPKELLITYGGLDSCIMRKDILIWWQLRHFYIEAARGGAAKRLEYFLEIQKKISILF